VRACSIDLLLGGTFFSAPAVSREALPNSSEEVTSSRALMLLVFSPVQHCLCLQCWQATGGGQASRGRGEGGDSRARKAGRRGTQACYERGEVVFFKIPWLTLLKWS
jgi:hypothetical protein